jgi:hypothetical protein
MKDTKETTKTNGRQRISKKKIWSKVKALCEVNKTR